MWHLDSRNTLISVSSKFCSTVSKVTVDWLIGWKGASVECMTTSVCCLLTHAAAGQIHLRLRETWRVHNRRGDTREGELHRDGDARAGQDTSYNTRQCQWLRCTSRRLSGRRLALSLVSSPTPQQLPYCCCVPIHWSIERWPLSDVSGGRSIAAAQPTAS